MLDHWNETIIALIPKVQCLERVTDLHPISLCNVVYKLISKVLANRLKKILPKIISPNQTKENTPPSHLEGGNLQE